MHKRVYFYIDELARDAVVAANLKSILAKRGVELIYGNKKFTEWYLKRCCSAFDAIIFPEPNRIATAFPDPELETPPIICLQIEAVGAISASEEVTCQNVFGKDFCAGDSRWVEKINAFCLWGHAQKDVIAAKHPGIAPLVHVVGQPRMDKHCLLLGVDKKKSRGKIDVGYVSRSDLLNTFDQRSSLETVYKSCGGRKGHYYDGTYEIEDDIYTGALDLRILFEFIDSFPRDKFTLHVRPHPRESNLSWQRLIDDYSLPVKLAHWKQPFAHWIHEMDFVMSPPSTSFYDSVIGGKNPINLSEIDSRRGKHDDPRRDGGNLINFTLERPESYEELLAILESDPVEHNKRIPEEALDIIRKEAHFPESLTSLSKTADVVMQVLEQTPDQDGFPRKVSLAKFKMHMYKHNRHYRRRYKAGRAVETSATYMLDDTQIRWIDSLASPEI